MSDKDKIEIIEDIEHALDIPLVEYEKRLEASLCVPSSVHGYSLAVEYMRDWFIEKFDKDYFKTVFINGKHVLDDYKRFSIGKIIKKEKPAVAMTPILNFEYDRNNQDMYMGGRDLLIGKFNHRKSFFKDWENNIFLGINLREMEVGFSYKVRVSSRAQQIDLYKHMELAFRVGLTQYEYIAIDFHIPIELMLNIAAHAGYEIDENEKIVDIVGFMNYVNAHSEFPMVYKLRTINGSNEFFMRVPNVYVHVACSDRMQADDGEREGMLDNNFHVDMMCSLRMMVPHYYVYKSLHKMYKYVPTLDSNVLGIYTFKIFDIPEINERKWNKYIVTAYEFGKDEMKSENIEIELAGLFNRDMRKVIDDNMKMGLSPAVFIDIVLYNYSEDSDCRIDWVNMILIIPKPLSARIHIAIYVDTEYYNDRLLHMK